MSSESRLIVCRRCRETIPMEEGNCPHCGAGIRRNRAFGTVAVFGLVLIGTAVLNLDQLYAFGILGLILAGIALFFLYDKRKRINLASDETV